MVHATYYLTCFNQCYSNPVREMLTVTIIYHMILSNRQYVNLNILFNITSM